ncbi:MAG TPA: cytochrome c oxidase subunit II [Longimicrobiales bacterium]|nr:cytochrome c oxidase subunit II [Longimicrobiales bacterium]
MTGNRKLLHSGALGSLLVVSVLLLSACSGEYPQTTFQPVTEFGELINGLFYNTTAWTMAILLIVEAVLIYILIRFRARPDAPEPKHIHGNTLVEIVWTVIPAIIVAVIAIPAVGAIFELQRPQDEGAFVVDVIGHQWWWEFRYPELEGVVTANEMHVPVGRMVYLNMRSADVIHSFWIPRIGGKRDVNPVPATREAEPERLNHLQFRVNQAGAYDGQCAEYCGDSHAIMRMRVIAHEPGDFQRWVQAYRTLAPAPTDSLAAHGMQVFMRSPCIACHSISGTSAIGRIGPNLTFMGDRWSVGAGAEENSVDALARWIISPPAMKPGARMPGTRTEGGGMPPTGLSEQDVRAIAAYLFSLRADAVPAAAPLPPGDTTDAPAGTGISMQTHDAD